MRIMFAFCLFFATTLAVVSSETLSLRFYQQLQAAEKLEAHLALKALDDLAQESLSPYEQALLLQQQAFIFSHLGKYKKSLNLFQKAIELNAMPELLTEQAYLNVAQVYIANEQWDHALKVLSTKLGKKKSGAVYALRAQALALKGNTAQATLFAEKAVAISDRPRANWLQLLLGLYLEQGFHQKGLLIAKQGAALYPKEKFFWQQLVGLYRQLKKNQSAIAALGTMHSLGLLSQKNEYLLLAQSYLSHKAAGLAALLLEEGLKKKHLARNEKNLTLLGDAWLSARAWRKALVALRQAAPMAQGGGALWHKIGSSFMQGRQWAQAERAFIRALDKGELSEQTRAQAWLLLGAVLAQQNKKAAAMTALQQAITFDSTSSAAKNWLDYLRGSHRDF